MLVSPSGSVALNSPITVPIAEFSAMVRLLALISVGAEFPFKRGEMSKKDTDKSKEFGTIRVDEKGRFRFLCKILEEKTFNM
jgi:hypothetical protein